MGTPPELGLHKEHWMIPTNRAVVGKDLDSIAQQFGMLVADACWFFGMSITKWMHVVRQNPDEPLRDPTLALFVRFLDANPKLPVMPQYPTAAEMYEMVNSVQAVDQKRFSVMFGSEASATYRWLKPGARMSPAVRRLMYYMRIALVGLPPEKRVEMLDKWRDTVMLEARARGVEDIYKTGAWKPKAKRPPRKRAAAKKVAEATA